MPQRDGLSRKQAVHLGNLSLSGTTPASSDWLDTRGVNSALLIPISNTVTDAGAAAGYVFEVEESDTTADADATAVASTQLVGLETDLTVTADGDDNSLAGGISYIGSKRYVRMTVTGSTGTDADVTVIGVVEKLDYEPKTFVGTAVAAT